MRDLIEKVSGQYGAPMGRPSYTLRRDGSPLHFDRHGDLMHVEYDDAHEWCLLRNSRLTFNMQRIRLDSGGYDKGGAYWGARSSRLYIARDTSDRVQRSFDVRTRADAIRELCEEFPGAHVIGEPINRTRVVFRVWKDTGDVIALFPDLPGGFDRTTCESFSHVGQHSGANYAHVITQTRPARADESEALRRELESSPYFYNLREVTRANRPAR